MNKAIYNKMLLLIFCSLLSFVPFSVSAGEKIFKNSVGMEFVLIPAGSFMMGADMNFEEGLEDELPRHKVSFTQEFYMGEYEVTQAQWVAVMGFNPSKFKDRKRPVEQVSWDDVNEFIKKLNKREGKEAYRLPTEAEWEYAARAGTDTVFFFGDDPDDLSEYGWYKGNSSEKTHPVAQLKKNAWGLYDMLGNVWEMCQDFYDAKYYSKSPSTNPPGPPSGAFKVARGGSCESESWQCRSAIRYSDSAGDRDKDLGFRLVFTPQR